MGDTRGTIDCCDHTFCFVCIVKWAKVKSFCPICKLNFTTIYGPQKNVVFASKRFVNVPQGNQVNHPFGNATSGLFNPHEEIKCRVCHGIADESNRRLLCDICDSAVHTYCVGFSATVPAGGAWFCYGCALSRYNHDKTKVNIAMDNQKISGNFNVKLPVETSVPFFGIARESNIPEVGHHNPSFSSLPNYLSPPFLAGRRILDEANGPSERGHHLSPHLGGKKSGKGRTRARVTELEQLVQSLQQKIEDEQEKKGWIGGSHEANH
ncbi:RING/U-box-like protein [Theobroma cacao]|uniref:RING/U-box-like protein n=1 Tax=Theobroma cacao TaxID=3641 RepID=A0A061FXF8_THECC|nr:RING/U-box-like protein [Theobroma cacao]